MGWILSGMMLLVLAGIVILKRMTSIFVLSRTT